MWKLFTIFTFFGQCDNIKQSLLIYTEGFLLSVAKRGVMSSFALDKIRYLIYTEVFMNARFSLYSQELNSHWLAHS